MVHVETERTQQRLLVCSVPIAVPHSHYARYLCGIFLRGCVLYNNIIQHPFIWYLLKNRQHHTGQRILSRFLISVGWYRSEPPYWRRQFFSLPYVPGQTLAERLACDLDPLNRVHYWRSIWFQHDRVTIKMLNSMQNKIVDKQWSWVSENLHIRCATFGFDWLVRLRFQPIRCCCLETVRKKNC